MSAAAVELLLPYQKRWIRDKSLIKVGEKSRRIGLTWCTALEAVMTAALRKSDGGTDVWYSVNNEDDAREFIEDCADWARGLGMMASEVGETMVVDEDKDILAFRIRFASGNKITALSSNSRRLRGKDGLAIQDEAGHADDLAAFLKAAKAFVMWGTGRLAIISTHNGVASEFNKLIQEIQAGVLKGTVHRITVDDALDEGLFRRMCVRNRVEWTQEAQDEWRADLFQLYGEDAGEELLCIPSGAGGRYFHRRVLEQCTDADAPVLRFRVDDDFATKDEGQRTAETHVWLEDNVRPVLARIERWNAMYFGEDFGRSSDLTVLCPMYLTANMRRVIPFLLEMRNVPFDQQKQVIWYVLDHFAARDKLVGGIFDAGGNGQYIAEAAALKYGASRIRQTYLAGGPPRDTDDRVDGDGNPKPSLRYSEALPPLKAAFEDRGISIPKDLDVIQDLEMFKRKDGLPYLPPHRVKAQDHGYRHGDAGVAIMLAHYATLEMQSQPTVITTRPRERIVRF